MDSLKSFVTSPITLFTLIFSGIVAAYAAFRPKEIEAPRRASEPMRELPQFQQPMKSNKKFGARRVSVAGESVKVEELENTKMVVHEKSDETKDRIKEKTKKLLLLRHLEQKPLNDIIDAMSEKKVTAGDEVIKQGDSGDFFYVIDNGNYDVLINGNKVTEYKGVGSFGELALLYGQPRAATVKATSDGLLWAVDRAIFRKIVLSNTLRNRKTSENFIKDVPLLSSLNEEEISKAADALQPVTFYDGEPILTQGEEGDTFYIIAEGSVSFSKIEDNGEKVDLGSKTKGEYFGEIALLTDGYRVASVHAKGKVECLVLDRPAFVRLLGPCEDILKRNMKNYAKYQQHF